MTQYASVSRSSSVKNAMGERVLDAPVPLPGFNQLAVNLVPASTRLISALEQRGITVTHQIVFPQGALVNVDDTVNIGGALYMVRDVNPLPRAVVTSVERTIGANA